MAIRRREKPAEVSPDDELPDRLRFFVVVEWWDAEQPVPEAVQYDADHGGMTVNFWRYCRARERHRAALREWAEARGWLFDAPYGHHPDRDKWAFMRRYKVTRKSAGFSPGASGGSHT